VDGGDGDGGRARARRSLPSHSPFTHAHKRKTQTSSHPGGVTAGALSTSSYAGPSPSPSLADALADAEAALASLRLAAAGGSASVIASPLVADAAPLGEAGVAPPPPPPPPAARVEVAVGGCKEKEEEEGGGGGGEAGDEPTTAAPPPPAPPSTSATPGSLGRPPPGPSSSLAAAATAAARPPTRVGPEDFTLLRVVGKGAFGKVFQVRQRGTGAVYAMKVMRKAPILAKGQGAYVRAERDVLTSVVHPYIVTLRYSFQTEAKLYLVLDFVAGGHLFFQLYRQGIFSEDLARLYTAEIVLAVAHLHGLGFVHRDLKPENVLLDAAGHVKVTDFGLAKAGLAHDEGGRAANSFIGTVEYMAPEVVAGRGHGKAVDWWSVGILLYEMLCGVPPFRAKGRAALQRQILGGKLKLPPYLSREAQALLRALLVREPPKRLGYGPSGSADVMGHAFFARVDWTALAEGRVASPFRPSLRQHDSVENFDRIWTDLAPEDSPVGTPREGGGVGGPPPHTPGGGGGGGGDGNGADAPPHTPPGAAFDGFTYIAPGLVEEAWAKAAAAAAAAAEAEDEEAGGEPAGA
jgi:ribosomal protein S6 kinase beta